MRPQNSLALPTDSLKRRARPLIARVRMKTDAQRQPYFKRVPQHQQLNFRIGRRANC